MQDTQLDWLQLIRSENVGPITFRKLVEFYGSAKRAIDAISKMEHRGGRKIKLHTRTDTEKELKAIQKFGGQIITMDDDAYPEHLKSCEDAPPVLTARGDIGLLSKPSIGIVGARNASLNGMKMTERFVSDIGAAGYGIVSGLARGIDTHAHKASLKTGTIAVIAGGLDVCYPKENQPLFESIFEHGLVIAESPFGTAPQARHFPKRNRIIAGLSSGILVVEAAQKSGSLITANVALDYGRDVYAIPGSPMDPRASGTNGLIKQNAALMVTRPDDIIHELERQNRRPLFDTDKTQGLSGTPIPMAEHLETIDDQTRGACRDEILNLLSNTPVAIDDILRHLDYPTPLILAILIELELTGHLQRNLGQTVNLIL